MKYLEHDSGELLKSERNRAIEARGWTKKQFGKKSIVGEKIDVVRK